VENIFVGRVRRESNTAASKKSRCREHGGATELRKTNKKNETARAGGKPKENRKKWHGGLRRVKPKSKCKQAELNPWGV